MSLCLVHNGIYTTLKTYRPALICQVYKRYPGTYTNNAACSKLLCAHICSDCLFYTFTWWSSSINLLKCGLLGLQYQTTGNMMYLPVQHDCLFIYRFQFNWCGAFCHCIALVAQRSSVFQVTGPDLEPSTPL